MAPLTVEDLFESKRESLGIELLAGRDGLDRAIQEPSLTSPGLVLAGYTERTPRGRIQVLGQTEMSFLYSLDPPELESALETLFTIEMPAVIVTKHQEVPPPLVEMAGRERVPLLRSVLKTGEFYRRLHAYLEDRFAPTTTLHGSLADVYGVGLMFVGESGIGKSECVLDLVERGHRLVADDVVNVRRRGNDILIGRGHELQHHHMEIRGIGIINIPLLFGIRAIRQQKRIEVVVQLQEWSDDTAYDRTGLDTEQTEILGVEVPRVVIPLNPGKNITVISEVVAMNHLLTYSGVNTAEAFDQRLQDAMRPVREYLEEDYE